MHCLCKLYNNFVNYALLLKTKGWAIWFIILVSTSMKFTNLTRSSAVSAKYLAFKVCCLDSDGSKTSQKPIATNCLVLYKVVHFFKKQLSNLEVITTSEDSDTICHYPRVIIWMSSQLVEVTHDSYAFCSPIKPISLIFLF